MYLVKCDCGCWYTLQENCLARPLSVGKRKCPNCGCDHKFDENQTIQGMIKDGFDITHIPDIASIEVKFNFPSFPNR